MFLLSLARARRFMNLFTTGLALAAPAAADSIADDNGPYVGIFADLEGTQTCTSVPSGTGTTLYLYAFPGGAVADGITAIEFRVVVTNPTGYLFFYTPPAGTPVVIGDPLDLGYDDSSSRGTILAYGDCRSGDRVTAGTIQVFNVSGGPTEIRVQRRRPPANQDWPCPLFVDCSSGFEKVCMRPCAVDESGSAIAARLGLNDPGCEAKAACPFACATAGCVDIAAATVSTPTCAARPVTVTTMARNCGAEPADIDVFVEQVLAGSFADVPAGQSVTASRTYSLPHCFNGSIEVGATAVTAGCAGAVGDEVVREPACTACANLPPDCSAAAATVQQLWPPDGRFVPVEVVGVTDPDGDPVSYHLLAIGSDERTGAPAAASTCPDAIIDGLTQVRLRAERDNGGDGRVYRIFIAARDPSEGECRAEIDVCVPRKLEEGCAAGSMRALATVCEAPPVGNREPIVAQAAANGSVEVTFEQASTGAVRLDVYDVRGRQVARLANGAFAHGRHVLRWDGRDLSGHDVSSGVYVVRLQTSEGAVIAKVALVR
jgi:hypothetical protein